MKRFIFLAICIFTLSLAIGAQTETVDLTTFTPPVGWTKQAKEGVTMYTNTTSKGYCLLAVYRSKASSGNVETDFQNEWKDLVVKPFQVTNPPTTENVQENDGWKSLAGTASFENEGVPSAALLTTVSGYGRTINILVILNNQDYMPVIENFLNSVKFTKPAVNNSEAPVITQEIPTTSGSSGITHSTTTFTDGWTGTVQDDYVRLTKDNLKIYLFYPAQMPDAAVSGDTAAYYWKTVVEPRFNLRSAQQFEDPIPDVIERLYYYEGSGTEKQTGQSGYIAMKVITGTGVARVIVALAPSNAVYKQAFPNPKDLTKMLNANRFAVTQADLVGHWKGGSGNAMQLYNVYTGANEGMTMNSSSDEFTFAANGTYQSRLVGASGQVGNTKFYDGKYSGQFKAANWETTLGNFGGRDIVFNAYFEAVKGGRILHLTQKGSEGNQFHLVKVN